MTPAVANAIWIAGEGLLLTGSVVGLATIVVGIARERRAIAAALARNPLSDAPQLRLVQRHPRIVGDDYDPAAPRIVQAAAQHLNERPLVHHLVPDHRANLILAWNADDAVRPVAHPGDIT
jgi:hypothetical protein